ncbi:MAG TPA: TonB-dependent receptor [Saprospiraceae bacterium]|nr:TonB-dependent receptor [Saprospiraceae bacterium]
MEVTKLPTFEWSVWPLKIAFTLLVALGLNTFLFSQNVTVRGVVTGGADNEPLIGVNVTLQGTTQGTITNIDGNYSIMAPSDGVLEFSYVGYLPAIVPIQGRTSIDVDLELDQQVLEEVVVIGYGTRKRSDITGSVVSLEEKEIREIAVASPEMALQGRMAGVNIDRTSSRPGAASQIRIRGNRSLGSDESGVNNPLIILDGIPYSGNISDISPNDIVNINILKDASSTAIYGSRGANGVIIITTRRGQTGAPRVTYNTYMGQSSTLGKYNLFDAEGYADLKQASNFGAPGGFFTPTEVQNHLAGRSTDWQDAVFQDGYITNHELGITGGGDQTRYSISLGYFDETTVMPGQRFNRGTLRLAIDQNISDRVRLGITSMNSLANTNGENVNPLFQVLTLSPLYNAYNEDGSINLYPAVGSVDANVVSPLALYNDNWSQDRRRMRTFNNAYAEIDLFSGFSYRINAGLDLWNDAYGHFYASETPILNGSGNVAARRNRELWSYTIEHLLLFNKSFGKHNIDFTGLYSVQEESSNSTGIDAQAIFADFIEYFNFGLAETALVPDGVFSYYKWGLISLMGRINYSYDGKYLFTLTMRRDGSSRLAEGNKWFTYPAAAFGWNVKRESFLQDVDFISNLKIRASIGRTSNQAVQPYASLGSLTRRPYNFGNDGVWGFLVNTLPNANLAWEFTTARNLGIDFGILNNRITGSIDIYSTNTDNVLQSRNVPVTAGVPGPFQENVGKTEARGVELMMSADIIRSRGDGFNFSVDFNFTSHRERITELAEGVTMDVGNGWFVGHPVNVIFDYQKVGIWQTHEADLAASFGDFRPGDIRVADLNGDGVIGPDDRTVLGQLDPRWMGGFTTRLSYKGIDMSVIGFTRQGGTLIATYYQMNPSNPINSLEGRRNGMAVDYWTPNNPTNDFPRSGNMATPFGSTVGYFDGSFTKIRAINLGYTLPKFTIGNYTPDNVRVYFNVNNPFRAWGSEFVRAGGLDPEPNGRGGTIGAAGFGRRLTVNADTPLTRSFILGLNFNF